MKSITFLCLVIMAACTSVRSDRLMPLVTNDTIFINSISYYDTSRIEVKVVNPNNRDVNIVSLVSSCGCLVSEFRDSIVKGNDSALMKILYTPAISGDSGSVMKTIAIRTNTNPPLKSVVIKAFVNKSIN